MTFILPISSIEKKKIPDKDLTGNLQEGKNNEQPKIPRFLQIDDLSKYLRFSFLKPPK